MYKGKAKESDCMADEDDEIEELRNGLEILKVRTTVIRTRVRLVDPEQKKLAIMEKEDAIASATSLESYPDQEDVSILLLH